jgi:uncharacterized protein
MRTLDIEQVEDIALGAAVLGTGGGGDPYIGKRMAQNAIRKHGPVRLLTLDEVEDDAWAAPVAMMGAPTIMIEKIPGGDECVQAFRSLQSFLGKPVRYTYSIEAGGLNSTVPIALAARLGIPMLDIDGMGRAFPEIQMVTHNLYGITATPFTMADEKGNSAVLATIDNRWMETFARSLSVDMGATATIGCYAARVGQLREAAIPGSLSYAERIGTVIRQTRAAHGDVVRAILDVTRGFVLFRGKIADVQRRTVSGFARGEATLEGLAGDAGHRLTVEFQNENLVARRDAEILVTVPDLIVIVEEETGEPITTEQLRYGFRVVVLGLPCDARWRTARALSVVGPRYFGYDVEYVPVEERFGR